LHRKQRGIDTRDIAIQRKEKKSKRKERGSGGEGKQDECDDPEKGNRDLAAATREGEGAKRERETEKDLLEKERAMKGRKRGKEEGVCAKKNQKRKN
jgi:hypothetical protein